MLAEPTDISENIVLIPRSGIQFVDLRVNADAAKRTSWPFHGDETLNILNVEPSTDRLFYYDQNGREKTVDVESFSVSLKDILSIFENDWVPLPFFRVQPPNGFSLGPVNWVRARMVPLTNLGGPDRNGNTHHLTLAFDTNLLTHVEGRDYLAPSREDARAGRVFNLAAGQEFLGDFVTAQWVQEWILDLYRSREIRRAKGKRKSDDLIFEEMRDMHGTESFDVACYLAFLDFLKDAGVARPVSMRDIDSDENVARIDVDLVLDLGNSRTCGILIESDPDRGMILQSATELELRDLSRPELIYKEPFDSRVEFHRVSFGKDNLSPLSGRSDAFLWPTIARVGEEATRLAGLREGTGGNTGMSSPKRYLWDMRSRSQSWRFNGKGIDGELEPYAKDGLFAQLVNRDGVPRHKMEPDDPENLPPVEAKYSRSSLVSFALAEIVVHAVTMINSPDYRRRRGHEQEPRRLRSIIMTMPTAMTKPERDILRDRANAAIELAWMSMGAELDEAALPTLEFQWDEASATQLVYLYTEVARTFAGDARAFFDLHRRPTATGRPDGTFRLASIDIGGGTTDLIITDYRTEGSGTAVSIIPDQRFREGFNVAGDDILRNVLVNHVLTVIEKGVRNAGVETASELMSELFGGDRSETGVAESTLRMQFVTHVAIPIGLAILAEYERHDPFGEADARALRYEDVFTADSEPSARIRQFLENKVIERGGTEFVLRELEFPVVPAAITETIASVLDVALKAMCEAVQHYDCDLLLLSGRPSRLPAVMEILRASLPVSPDRIVPLHRYRVGDWYPFRDAAHRIKDPKTTAAVGAMIGAIARGRLPQFAFRSDMLHARSTIRIIGKIDHEGRIRKGDEYYADVNLDDEEFEFDGDGVQFTNTSVIGFRQLPIERWPATQLYVLDYGPDDRMTERLRKQTPLKIKLSRSQKRVNGALGEALKIESVEGSTGEEQSKRGIEMRLQTLQRDQGYWIDTGAIR